MKTTGRERPNHANRFSFLQSELVAQSNCFIKFIQRTIIHMSVKESCYVIMLFNRGYNPLGLC